MKKINELTEQEILNLSSEEIDKMIRFRMAEEGIKFLEHPVKPLYLKVDSPKEKVYYCHLLGQKLSFTDMSELTSVLDVLMNCKTICSIDSNYELPEANRYYMKHKVENASYSSDSPDTISSVTVYTHKEFQEAKIALNENAKAKKEYEAKVKEYEVAIKDAQWVSDEIWERIDEVRTKYDKLNNFIYRFKNEYLPLSDNNEEIAMNFLNKAYSLDIEQQEYVLANYKEQSK